MNELLTVTAALGPVFALVVIGVGLRWLRFPSLEFWPLAERFTYYLLFPSLLVLKISTTELPVVGVDSVILALLLVLAAMILITLVCGRWLGLGQAASSSFFQGGVRFNTYVGLAAATELFGETGLLWGALFLGLMIPLKNIACVVLFVLLGNGRSGWGALFKSLFTNPLILACLLGAVLNLSGLGMPGPLVPVLELLSRAALPLGLLAVGFGLELRALKSGGAALWSACALKLLLYPLLFAGLALLLDLPEQATAVLLVFAAVPTSPAAYILARQLGGDAPLMAAIITVQTLLAMLTMPLLLALLG
ncbi:AEC family transporter [Motiliproteus sp.]|uniref:AEC family transporter n=1 Tax=Motiliproteus sp. TaxID=1898955 RepID=UPI003BADA0B9